MLEKIGLLEKEEWKALDAALKEVYEQVKTGDFKIDKGIDTGNIIYQKLLDFELNKNRRKLTFKKTYSTLISEIENLFFNNSKNLLNNEYDEFEQIGSGTYHSSNELPVILKSWNQNIFNTINKYNIEKNNNIDKKIKFK